MFELPPELTVKPIPLVGLTGLDLSNSIHRSIWEALSNNRRPEGPTVQFRIFSLTHEFPTVKPKCNAYEWYVPKGILKRNWMNKYLNEIPAVMVVFYDLDWNDPQWNEKKMEFALRVQSVRAALEGRSTKIVIALVQHCTQLPLGPDDPVATDRANALCSACDLTLKFLYLVPHADHLLGYSTRLENSWFELAQTFYHHEYRIVKGHRDQLNKTMHQHLFVRHQFKMGFLNELKQDFFMALKQYEQAYKYLLDVRISDTNVTEIKTIAGFINYKLCKLMFHLNSPKEAISQFRVHTDRFKLKTGPKELMFEHHAWMCEQHSTFAELFDDAIHHGLPALQTQHPGCYFQSAAHHASLRRAACYELCKNIESYPEPDPLTEADKLEFYGQRPWRPGKLSAEPADLEKEAIAIQALQYKEKTSIDHTLIIIGLLGHAISQFKVHRCPRMKRVLVVQMAEEYYNYRDYGKVLTLLMHMLWEYHGERWPVLLTNILRIALRAAFLSTSIQDYLTLALEALGPFTTFTEQDQAAIYDNINKILQKKAPNPDSDIPREMTEVAVEKWRAELERQEPTVFTIDDNNMSAFVEVKARFLKSKYIVNEAITADVIIRNSYCGAIQFSKISAIVSSPGFSTEFVVASTPNSDLRFRAKEMRKFPCNFHIPQSNDDSEIRITSISLYMGNETSCCIILRYTAIGRAINCLDHSFSELQQLRGEFESIRSLVTAQIKHKESSLSIRAESNIPALLGEWFPIKIFITANESIPSAILNVTLLSDGSNDQSTELSSTLLNKESVVSIPIGKLEKNCVSNEIVYIRAHKIGDRNIMIKVEYSKNDQLKRCEELVYSVSVTKPFEVATLFYTTLFEPLVKGFVNEPFIIMPHISCVSPWPINIISTSIELGECIEKENSEEPTASVLAGVTLSVGETGSDAFRLIPRSSSDQPVSIGVYTIKWKRAEDDNALETSSSVTLAPLWVEDAVIGLEAKLPPHGWVRTPLLVAYFIKNHSDFMITLRLTMETSSTFMFAGQKQVDIFILPKNERKVEWILRPMVAGFVALPTLSLAVAPEEENKVNKVRLSEIVERSVPSHIYILPTSQGLEEETK